MEVYIESVNPVAERPITVRLCWNLTSVDCAARQSASVVGHNREVIDERFAHGVRRVGVTMSTGKQQEQWPFAAYAVEVCRARYPKLVASGRNHIGSNSWPGCKSCAEVSCRLLQCCVPPSFVGGANPESVTVRIKRDERAAKHQGRDVLCNSEPTGLPIGV
jgi:hypothetical protein